MEIVVLPVGQLKTKGNLARATQRQGCPVGDRSLAFDVFKVSYPISERCVEQVEEINLIADCQDWITKHCVVPRLSHSAAVLKFGWRGACSGRPEERSHR